MRRYHLIFIAIFSTFIIYSCVWLGEDLAGNPFITIDNQSDKEILLFYTFDYPDTTLYREHFYPARNDGPTPPHTKEVAYCKSTRQEVFGMNPIVQIFVVDYKQWRDNSLPSEVRWSYLRRYELTRKWLEEHDWTVTYP